MTQDTSDGTKHTWRCSECLETWEMVSRPLACPACGRRVVGGYREVREVAVDTDQERDVLPEFEDLIDEEADA